MKRKTLKRKISIVGILVFVSMIVYSCWQDEWSSNVTDEVIFDSNKELTIAKAEQWYNATNPSATTVRSLRVLTGEFQQSLIGTRLKKVEKEI